MSRVFVGVGSNEGERLVHISGALQALGAIEGVRLVQVAPIIETEPLGGPPQGLYLNTVVEIDTALEPFTLLQALQRIEQRGGRRPKAQRWASRPIDLDLLLYGDRVINEPSLMIPHPLLHERYFVLEPLIQIAPRVVHPTLHQSMTALFEILLTQPSASAV